MSQYHSFHCTFSILFVTYLSFNWFSWKIPITTSPEEFFFMDIEKPFTFFMVKKGIESNHNNLLTIYTLLAPLQIMTLIIITITSYSHYILLHST